ncbi:npp-24 [Pristionchus pacificus]|uniref:Uncharacterized protein n=1 Tax=Pristionchus pacificus TaxID=54126 RepID=A0A2A6CCN4_PRIPA|nr:npp-24 [Pristionchus pacificus]|eukprot:PDM75889.1 hypothetical protein PRIPAC_38520 [Pristionchus pacificus]
MLIGRPFLTHYLTQCYVLRNLFLFRMKLNDFSVDENVTAISSYGHNRSLLVACGSNLFLLFGVNPSGGSVQVTKKVKLVSSVSFPSPITRITPDPNGPRVALLGSKFAIILSVPIELWSNCGVAELLQQKYFCESSSIQESVFLGDAQPLQLEWTSEKGGDDISSFIVVLSSDCAIRFYELNGSTGIEYPKVKIDLLTLMPHLSSTNQNSYGLFRSIVSFTIFCHSSRFWHLLLIDSDGESHISTVYQSNTAQSIHPLNLPVEINSAVAVHSSNDNIFTSVIASSANGILHHLAVVLSDDGADAIRIVDSLSLPSSILSIIPFKSGALVQTIDSLFILDLSSSQRYLTAIALGESLPSWEGMDVVECAHILKGSFLSSIPCICIEIETDLTLVVYVSEKGLESLAISHEWETKSVDRIVAGPSSVSGGTAVEVKIKEMLKDLKIISKNIGSSKSEESELISSFISTLSSIKHNFQVLRNSVHHASTWMTSNCVSRVDAVNGAREIQNGSILSLYDTLRQSEERMYNNRLLTQSLIHKANLLWNCLSSRSIDSSKEIEMIKTLKEHSKQLDHLATTVPKVTLDMEMAKRVISRTTESSTRLKRRADVVSIRDEIEALEIRCEGIDKMMI